MKNFFKLKKLGTVFLLASLSVSLHAANVPKEILLWPNGAPGSEGKTGAEKVRIANTNEHVISNIHKPSIMPFLPSKRNATGCAVIVAPGGGHRELWIDHEGYAIARWLSERGIAAFVLKYRLARETNSTYTVDGHALADAQRAVRLVRNRAKEWNIDPARIGIMGFSAGGEVAFLTAQRFDQPATNIIDSVDGLSARPDFQALIYPGNTQRFQPATNSPPAFLLCGGDDRISAGLPEVYLKFKQVKVPAELHIYAGTGHGFGLRPNNTQPVRTWLERFDNWLAASGFLKKQ